MITFTRLLCLAGFVGACGEPPPGVTVTMRATDEAPAYGDTPFPTDAVKTGERIGRIAGLEAIVTRHEELVTNHVAELDGFGLRPVVELFVDGEIDPASLTAEVAGLVDVDPASPERGRAIAMDWRYDAERGVIAGSPTSGVVLREGTRYAAFVTTGITDPSGAPIAPIAPLPDSARWRTTADALGELGLGRTSARIAGIATFTTQHASAQLVAARDALLVAEPPTLHFDDPAIIFKGTAALDRILGRATRATEGPRAGLERWGNDNPTGIAHAHVGVIGTGTTTSARFRGAETNTDGPEDETFERAPRVLAYEPIPVTFVLPAAAPPAAGYPVVIVGHGLGASRDQILSFAEPLTAAGFALVAIDMSGHGSRYDAGDTGPNMAAQLAAFTGEPGVRDGFGDTTGLSTTFDLFEGFMNVTAVRDSIRQSALDLSRLAQLVRSDLDLTALAPNAKLDPQRIAYMGESFGGVVGTLFAAIEPDVDLFVLDVPGGGILDLLLPTSAEIGTLALPIIDALYQPRTQLDRWNPMIGLMQAVIDGADPLTYAPHILRDRFTIGGAMLSPRHLVALEVLGDQVLSNRGTDALAQALQLQVLAPHLAAPAGLASVGSPAAGNVDGQTAVLVQYAPATHGANWSSERGTLSYFPAFPAAGPDPFPRLPAPITIANPLYETLAQVTEILETHRTGTPVVRMTKPPVPDFDADGVLDDADPAPFDPAVPGT